jgi:hypothetical protein
MKLIYRYCPLILTLLMVLAFASPARAHGDEPRLEITPERVNPGGVVDVRGVAFEREESINLMLVNGQSAIPFGEIVADSDGMFLQSLIVPVDLPEGTYNFLAITDDHNITSPDLVVKGPPITTAEGGGQGLRDEDDPLLAPMPTFAPGVAPAIAPGPTQTFPAKEENRSAGVPVLALAGSVLAAGVLFYTFLRRRSR